MATSSAVASTLEIDIRDYRTSDESFIMSAWKKSNRMSSSLPSRLYFPVMQNRIENIMRDDSTVWKVATDPSDELIIGWAVATGEVLHYVYTRHAFRRAKVATRLLRALSDSLGGINHWPTTHWTEAADAIAAVKPNTFSYEPERLGE